MVTFLIIDEVKQEFMKLFSKMECVKFAQMKTVKIVLAVSYALYAIINSFSHYSRKFIFIISRVYLIQFNKLFQGSLRYVLCLQWYKHEPFLLQFVKN